MTALVTGAAHRIGRALALSLAADGWLVALHYHRSAQAAQDLAEEITRAGGQAFPVDADLAREDEVQTLIPRLLGEIGPIGLLVNNASVFERDQAMTATRTSWDLHMETNLRAPFVLSQIFAAQLPEGQSGSIVNVIDQRVWNLTPDFTSYTISKAGLWALTQMMAMALAPNIRVNAIGPGPTFPNWQEGELGLRREALNIPLEKSVSGKEIADGVLYLARAPSVTGVLLCVDGGQHLAWRTPDTVDD